jgi:hypothetical protein
MMNGKKVTALLLSKDGSLSSSGCSFSPHSRQRERQPRLSAPHFGHIRVLRTVYPSLQSEGDSCVSAISNILKEKRTPLTEPVVGNSALLHRPCLLQATLGIVFRRVPYYGTLSIAVVNDYVNTHVGHCFQRTQGNRQQKGRPFFTRRPYHIQFLPLHNHHPDDCFAAKFSTTSQTSG